MAARESTPALSRTAVDTVGFRRSKNGSFGIEILLNNAPIRELRKTKECNY